MKRGDHLSDQTADELELSAVDLVALSLPTDDPLPDHEVYPTQRADRQPMTSVSRAPTAASTTKRAYAAGIVGLLVVAGIAAAAHYKNVVSESEPVTQVPVVDWSAAPEEAETAEIQPPPPTRFQNPFDKNEIFELAPGLTQAEARERVAELLMERARQRM